MISSNSKKKYFYSIILKTLGLILLIYFISTFFQEGNKIEAIITSLINILWGWFLIFGFPLFLLYSNHYFRSKGISFSKDDDIFNYKSIKDSFSFGINDVEKIELYLTTIKYKKNIDIQGFGEYHFQLFILKNNKKIAVSCLLYDTVEDDFPKELISIKKKFFPLLKNNYDNINLELHEEKETQIIIPKRIKTSSKVVEHFLEKFSTKNKFELENIIENPKSYQPEAVEAAELLIEQHTKSSSAKSN